MEQDLSQNSILMKNYADHVKKISELIQKVSLQPYRDQELPVVFLRSKPR